MITMSQHSPFGEMTWRTLYKTWHESEVYTWDFYSIPQPRFQSRHEKHQSQKDTSHAGFRSRGFIGRRRFLPCYRLATSRYSWCCFRKIEDRSAMAEYVSSRQDFTVITMIEEVLNDDLQVERFQDLWQLRVRLRKTEGRSQGLTQIENTLWISESVILYIDIHLMNHHRCLRSHQPLLSSESTFKRLNLNYCFDDTSFTENL